MEGPQGNRILAVLATLLAAAALWAPDARALTIVETFAADVRIEFVQPGVPDGGGGLDFDVQLIPNGLDFTPGSVTFEGQPVDFDGTEASFLASSYTGTANVPVSTGPGVTDFHFELDVAGAFNGPWIFDLSGVQLGPGFSDNFLDVLPGPVDMGGLASNWSSAVVPELNGADVIIQGRPDLLNVSPTNAGFDLVGPFEILAAPEPSILSLAILGLLALAVVRTSR